MTENKKAPEIRVTDRRVSQEGEAKAGSKAEKPKADVKDTAPGEPREVPPIDFTTFLLSLSSSALAHLGEVSMPGHETENLALARQSIDLLGILEEKTAGNLTGEEERLLSHLLMDLRMRYVQKAQSK